MSEPALLTSEADGILTVTLNRPEKLNAITAEMVGGIRAAVDLYARRDDLRVFLIRGVGRYFSAGADQVSGRGGAGPDRSSTAAVREYYRTNMMGGMQPLYDEMEAIEKPFVAAHHATCMGGGLEMSLSCDFRLAAKSARYVLPENKLGAIPASNGVSRLTRLVGVHWAKWMIMGSQPVEADQALSMGLVHAIYEDAEFDAKVQAFCLFLAGQPREMMAMAKLTIGMAADAEPGRARLIERLGQSILHGGAESDRLHAEMRRKLTKNSGA